MDINKFLSESSDMTANNKNMAARTAAERGARSRFGQWKPSVSPTPESAANASGPSAKEKGKKPMRQVTSEKRTAARTAGSYGGKPPLQSLKRKASQEDLVDKAPGESGIPRCYKDMEDWKRAVKGMMSAHKKGSPYSYKEMAAVMELYEAVKGQTKKIDFAGEYMVKSFAQLQLFEADVKRMRLQGPVPEPWRPDTSSSSNPE